MNNWTKNWQENAKKFKERCFSERARLLADLENPQQAQKEVFEDLLNISKDTEFGKLHQLNNVNSIKDFQKNVPIRSYDKFAPWIKKEVEAKGGILTNSPIARWLKTSGSTGESKKVPYTEHWMGKYRVPALCVLWANYLQSTPAMLSHPYATLDTQTVRENPSDFLNGIPYQGITNRHPLINEADWQLPWYDAPWFVAEVPTDYDTRMYYRLRYFVGEDLRAIVTINPSTLIALQQNFITKLPLLIKDVREGTVCGKKVCKENPALSKKLEKFLDKKDVNLKEVWPNLELISCWTSASAQLYLSQLEQIFPGVKVLPFMSCGTEGIVTLPIDDHPITGPLAINQGFYEFLPADVDIDKIIEEENGVETLLFDQLELGKEYHLIMSQGSGMLRYAVGDLYKVTDFYKQVPKIEYSSRHGTYNSFTGEKLTEPQLLSIVQDVTNEYKLDKSLFMFCPVWSNPPYYKMLLEIDKSKNQSDFHDLLEDRIDTMMRDYNEEYDSKRKSNRLGKIKLYFAEKGSVNKYLEIQKTKANAVQFKYKPFQKDEKAFNEILKQAV